MIHLRGLRSSSTFAEMAKVGVTEVGFADVDGAEVGVVEISLTEVDGVEVGMAEVDMADVGVEVEVEEFSGRFKKWKLKV